MSDFRCRNNQSVQNALGRDYGRMMKVIAALALAATAQVRLVSSHSRARCAEGEKACRGALCACVRACVYCVEEAAFLQACAVSIFVP